jgi:DNA-binding beta-propeller fold protein YncE
MARTRAPELRGVGGWVNTETPLTLASLRGRIVVLDFWTFCCINCIRVLEELRPIEARFGGELVVIGVHSPKFPHEADHDALRRAVARHRIPHPVLDDPELASWEQYGIKGWPTLVVIDPEGYVVGGVSGEGAGPVIERAVTELIAEHTAKGTLLVGPPAHTTTPPTPEPLAYPGKVASDGEDRLAIADTGHDRVLVTDREGRVERVVEPLSQPQGVAFDGAALVVCDTGADRVLTVDLRTGAEVVIAEGLASPWDVTVEGPGQYVVAEAGRHRLWRVGDGGIMPAAGTGSESLVDGPAADALLAQPSGVAVVGGGVAFVDAEASALRVLTEDDRVVTLVGSGLFDWGRADGPSHVARLQHPLGVAAHRAADVIWVADTYNSMLAVWEGKHEMLRGLPVEGLDEPGGLDVLPDGRLVVADTNNHRVVIVDPDTGVIDLVAVDETWRDAPEGEALWVAPGRTLPVPFSVSLDGGETLDVSDGPPVRVSVSAEPASLLGNGPRAWALSAPDGEVEVVTGRPGEGTLHLDVSVAACDDDRCTVHRLRRRHRITVREGL